jgi:hypothetical protein
MWLQSSSLLHMEQIPCSFRSPPFTVAYLLQSWLCVLWLNCQTDNLVCVGCMNIQVQQLINDKFPGGLLENYNCQFIFKHSVPHVTNLTISLSFKEQVHFFSNIIFRRSASCKYIFSLLAANIAWYMLISLLINTFFWHSQIQLPYCV